MNTIKATNDTIRNVVYEEIGRLGHKADLNHIDVSEVTSMNGLFEETQFNGDISKWDTSKVESMARMFRKSKFNGDISQWDVSNAKHMGAMFEASIFKGDISKWDISKVSVMGMMFRQSKFNGDISDWDVSNAKSMIGIFSSAKQFNGDISKWNIAKVEDLSLALVDCPLAQSENFGAFHLACKAESPSLKLHPRAEAAWSEHQSLAQSMGLEGPELGRAVWTSYQASIGQAQPMDDLVDMDFTMSTDWTVGCDPTEDNKQRQVSTSNDLAY